MALSIKQERFIAAYLGEARGNGTEAARLAGYRDAAVSAHENKQNPVIRARIEERLITESLSSGEVLAELTDIARADWRHFLQIKLDHEGNTIEAKVVLGDKVKALELIGKYHKMFVDRTELTGKDQAPITFTLNIDRAEHADVQPALDVSETRNGYILP